MALKLYTSVKLGLKLKVRKFFEDNSYVCRSYRGKTVWVVSEQIIQERHGISFNSVKNFFSRENSRTRLCAEGQDSKFTPKIGISETIKKKKSMRKFEHIPNKIYHRFKD